MTLITGGTRGIGAATALRLAEAGHDLVLGFRGDVAAAEHCRRLVQEAGARCILVRADLTDAAGVDRLFTDAAEAGLLTESSATPEPRFTSGPSPRLPSMSSDAQLS